MSRRDIFGKEGTLINHHYLGPLQYQPILLTFLVTYTGTEGMN